MANNFNPSSMLAPPQINRVKNGLGLCGKVKPAPKRTVWNVQTPIALVKSHIKANKYKLRLAIWTICDLTYSGWLSLLIRKDSISPDSEKGFHSMEKRLIELAIEALELRKAAIDAELTKIRATLSGGAKAAAASQLAKAVAPAPTRKRGPRSKAARKAQSERMKLFWAQRRAEKAKAAGKEDVGSKKKK
jgi:hypothetical protein